MPITVAYNKSHNFSDDGGDSILVEPIVVKREFPAQWTKGSKHVDLTELGRLRFVERWTINQLSKYFNWHRSNILKKLKEVKSSWT